MKIGFSQFYHPTPDKIRLFAKSITAASTGAAAIVAITGGNPAISWSLVAFAFVGSFLTNFISEDNIKSEIINKPGAEPIKADVQTDAEGTKTVV